MHLMNSIRLTSIIMMLHKYYYGCMAVSDETTVTPSATIASAAPASRTEDQWSHSAEHPEIPNVEPVEEQLGGANVPQMNQEAEIPEVARFRNGNEESSDELSRAKALLFYLTMPFTYLQRRNNYWSLLDDQVYMGAAPISLSFLGLDTIKKMYTKMHIRGVVNVQAEYEGPVGEYQKWGIEQLYLPTIDHTEPTLEAIEKSIVFIEKTITGNPQARVLIHCKAGHGRSAAIAFCWMLYRKGWTLEETQEYLNTKRDVRKELYLQPNIIAYYDTLARSQK